jgi:hypothetical protein
VHVSEQARIVSVNALHESILDVSTRKMVGNVIVDVFMTTLISSAIFFRRISRWKLLANHPYHTRRNGALRSE